jgi:hypothetical protein
LEYGPTLDGRDIVGPLPTIGETVDDSVTVPLNPFMPRIVMVKLADEPRFTVWLVGVAVIVKLGVAPLVLKIAVCTLSGTGFGVPFAILTHKGGLLVCVPHPVWKPRLVPELVPVIL